MLFISKKVLLLVLSLIMIFGLTAISAADNTTNIHEDNINRNSTSNIDANANLEAVNMQDNNKISEKNIINSNSTSKVVKTAQKKNVVMSATNTSIKYQSKVKLTATVKTTDNKNITGGYVVFKLNDNTIGRADLINSKAYLYYNTNKNTPKDYKITAKYSGTSQYNQNTAKATLTVLKFNSKITLNNKVVTHDDKVQFTATATDEHGNYIKSGKVAFKLNGNTIGRADLINGKANFIYNATLPVSKYKLTAVVGETQTTYKATSNTATLTINPIETKMSITNKTVPKSENVELTATVVNKKTGKYMTTGRILFKLDGATLGYANVKNGKAYFKYTTRNLAEGSHSIVGIYEGSNAKMSEASGKLSVNILKYSYSQIQDAAIYLRNHYEANQILKNVEVNGKKMNVESFLPLILHALKNANRNHGSDLVEYVYYPTISAQSDNLKGQTLTTSRMLSIASDALNYYQTHHKAPTYVMIDSYKFGFYNMLYSFSKMIDYSTSGYLPKSCRLYNWDIIHPQDPTKRTIYITSDNIRSKSKDQAFINDIKAKLQAKGFTVKVVGIGPNTHNYIRNNNYPDNAAQLSIFGGADAGVFYDMSTRSFMRGKANRPMFLAFYPTARDITNLAWLERAHDDNYSPASFKGLAHPDQYLYKHGYDYVYSGDTSEIVNSFIEYISSGKSKG